MSIPVSCSCGQQFMAQPHLAGKQVACPSCGKPLSIPSKPGGSGIPTESAKSETVVTCACGASFKAPPHLLGQRVPCPTCSRPIDIPAAEGSGKPKLSPPVAPAAAPDPEPIETMEPEPADDTGLGWDDSFAAPVDDSLQGSLGTPYAAPQRTQSESIQPMTMYAIWAGASAVVLLILVIVGHLIWNAFSDDGQGSPTSDPATESAPVEPDQPAAEESPADDKKSMNG